MRSSLRLGKRSESGVVFLLSREREVDTPIFRKEKQHLDGLDSLFRKGDLSSKCQDDDGEDDE